MLSKSSKWVVVLPFLVVAAANAAPTVSNFNRNCLTCAVSPSSPARILLVPEITQIAERCDSNLAGIAAEFLKPPLGFTNSPTPPPTYVKSLPAVPRALSMVLMGFLCVSLVKDRRVWLAALAGLLWAGQTGIQALPQLALYLSHGSHNKQQSYPELTHQYYLENSNRLRSDIEGTRYIGLLRRLAGIPNATPSLSSSALVTSLRAQRSNLNSASKLQTSAQNEDNFRAPQFAITHLFPCLIPQTNCLASRAKQFNYFSPAFIFDSIPRGPPAPT